MRRDRLGTIALALAWASATPAAAQQRIVSVHGIAWDSLRNAPMPGAIISITGTGRTGAADPRGRFQIDSVPVGAWTFVMSHDAVDAAGLTAISGKFDVTDGRAEVRLALPSFATFWKAGCAGKPPKDSSLVYGVIRRPGSGTSVKGAKVELAWLDMNVKGKKDVQQRVNRLETVSDSVGNYGFCGVPNGAGFRVRASTEAGMSGIIDMAPTEDRLRWRDLSIGQVGEAPGMVRGTVSRAAGVPFPDALVSMEDAGEVRTDSAGRFSFARVPGGTRQLQVNAVGLDPVTMAVDVVPGDTTRAAVNLDRITTLGSVRVTGTTVTARIAAGLTERRKIGLGTFVDSMAIRGVPLMRSALSTIPAIKLSTNADQGSKSGMSILAQREPTITMRNGCTPALYLDGVRQPAIEVVWMLSPDEVGLFEVYPSEALLPIEFAGAKKQGCVLAVWTKRALNR